MAGGLDRAALLRGLAAIAAAMKECEAELNEADGKLGDGDLGVTMTRGMDAISKSLPDLPADVGMALFACAKSFTQVSGSSFGTLVATGLMAAAKECKGKDTVPWIEVATLLDVALDSMKARGKAEIGDKTVLDSLAAMAEAARGLNQPAGLAIAVDGATNKSLEIFRDKECQQGRARMFGDKSIGVDDPGMLVIKRCAQALRRCTSNLPL